MSEIKLFLRDFITPAKIKRYAGYVFVFAVFIQIFFQDQAVFRLSGSAGSMIGYGIAFTSAVYVTHTYPVFENIGFYLALPVKKWKMYGAYFAALWICTLLQRISFAVPVVVKFSTHVAENLLLLILNSGTAVLLSIGLLLAENSKKWGILIWNLVLAAALPAAGYLDLQSGYQAVLSVCIAAGAAASFRSMKITDLMIIHEPKKNRPGKCAANYFYRVAVTEKIYLANTACIIVFLIVLCMISRENQVMMNLVWCTGAVNTPFLTMISADLQTSRHIDMLPSKKNSIYKQYFIFLLSYFLLINSIILLAKYMIFQELIYRDVFLALLSAPFETALAGMLERKRRITGWQTKQELWKNPRKYVLPLAVFIGVSVYYSAGI